MRYAAEVLVLISGTSVDVNSNAGKVAWKSFGGDADAVWKCCYLIKFCWVLDLVSHVVQASHIYWRHE